MKKSKCCGAKAIPIYRGFYQEKVKCYTCTTCMKECEIEDNGFPFFLVMYIIVLVWLSSIVAGLIIHGLKACGVIKW